MNWVTLGPQHDVLIIDSQSWRKRANDVSEIYSPPRITAAAKDVRIKSGWALELTTGDENGCPWDFNLKRNRDRAKALICESKPMVLVGSPMCTWFSRLQALNKNRYKDPKAAEEMLRNSVGHMQFECELYEEQMRAGRYFVHEHPDGATSWNLSCMKKLLRHPRVIECKVHMCAYGMKSRDELGEGLVMKPTRMITNSEEIANELKGKCCGGHRHVPLLSGRAKAAAEYPPKLCEAICRGVENQKGWKKKWADIEETGLSNLEVEIELSRCDEKADERPGIDVDSEKDHEAWDDLKGCTLDGAMEKKAREVEMGYVYSRKVYKYCSRDEAIGVSGKPPIGVRRIDTNKQRR